MELRKPLNAALKAFARWRDDGDVALALLHAQAMSANDPGWSHCSEVFLRGIARAINACADELAGDDGSGETLAGIGRNLALAAQVTAGLAAEMRHEAQRRAENDPPTSEPDACEPPADDPPAPPAEVDPLGSDRPRVAPQE